MYPIIKKLEEFSVHGIEVVQDDKIILTHLYDEDVRYPVYSATKTLTSAAVGLAINNGDMSIDKPLASYLEESYLSAMQPEQRNSFLKLNVERFLTMSVSGFPFRPSGEDWLSSALDCGEGFSAKPEFSYSNVSAYLVGIACENAVGMPLMDYLSKHLLEPLGIINPPFQVDPQGRFYGATGIHLTVHELALVGRLYLKKGIFGDVRLLSEEWISLSIRSHTANASGGYGYFIWVDKDNSFSISGKWGQKSLVYPEKNLVITYLSDMPEHSEKVLEIVKNFAQSL